MTADQYDFVMSAAVVICYAIGYLCGHARGGRYA